MRAPAHWQPTDDVVAVVLARGQGRRLMPLTTHRPRAAVPFGATRRLVDVALSNLVNGGVARIAILGQYRAVAGSAIAVRRNADLLRREAPAFVIVASADHVGRLDPRPMVEAHRDSGAAVSVAAVQVPIERAGGVGVVELDDHGAVRALRHPPAAPRAVPYAPDRAYASTGIYVFTTAALLDALDRDAARRTSAHDLDRSVVAGLAHRCEVALYDLGGNRPPGTSPYGPVYWRQVRDIDSYFDASMDLLGEEPAFDPRDRAWPIRESLAGPPPQVDGTVRRSVLSPGVVVHAGAVVEDSVLMERVEVGPGAVVRRAVIDQGVKVPAGAQVGVYAAGGRAGLRCTERGVVTVGRGRRAWQRRRGTVTPSPDRGPRAAPAGR